MADGEGLKFVAGGELGYGESGCGELGCGADRHRRELGAHAV